MFRGIGAALGAIALLSGASAAAAQTHSDKYTYDALGRLVSVVSSNGVRISYSYDAAGNRTVNSTVGGKPIVLPMRGLFVIIVHSKS